MTRLPPNAGSSAAGEDGGDVGYLIRRAFADAFTRTLSVYLLSFTPGQSLSALLRQRRYALSSMASIVVVCISLNIVARDGPGRGIFTIQSETASQTQSPGGRTIAIKNSNGPASQQHVHNPLSGSTKSASPSLRPADSAYAIASNVGLQNSGPAAAGPLPRLTRNIDEQRVRGDRIRSDDSADNAALAAQPVPPRTPSQSPTQAPPPARMASAPSAGNAQHAQSEREAAHPRPSFSLATASEAQPEPPAPVTDIAAGYFVQIAADKTPEAARSSYRGVKAKHADLLGARKPVIRRKNLGRRGVVYEVQVGPMSRDDASDLCARLKSAGSKCLVVHN